MRIGTCTYIHAISCIFSIETVAASHPVVMTSCASTARAVVTMCEVPPSSLLTPSLFRGLPPVIHFPRPDEKCEEFIDFNPDYKSLVLSAYPMALYLETTILVYYYPMTRMSLAVD